MVALSLLLLLLGAVLLIVEMFIPGFGVFGITGIILFIISSVISILYIPFGIFILLGELLLLTAILVVMLKFLKKRQFFGKIILDETLNEDTNEIGDPDLFIGKEGITKTPLKPFGFADFNGTVMEVTSDGQYISENIPVKIIEASKNKLVVRLKNTKEQ